MSLDPNELAAYEGHKDHYRGILNGMVLELDKKRAARQRLRSLGSLIPDPQTCDHTGIPCLRCFGVDQEDLLRDLAAERLLAANGFRLEDLRPYLRG